MTARLARRAAILVAVGLPAGALAAVNPQTPIAGSAIPRFRQALPLLSVAPQSGTISTHVANDTSFASPLPIRMCEFRTQVLPPPMPPTWTWGYVIGTNCPSTVQDTYLGPVLVNIKGTPTTIRFTNALPTVAATKLLAYKYSTDQTIHWADPLGTPAPGMPSTGPEGNMCHMASGDPPTAGFGIPAYHTDECSLNFGEYWDPSTGTGGFNPMGIPAVPHLHGGEVPPVLDGGPDAWFTSDGFVHGHGYYTNPNVPAAGNEAVYTYPNSQAAAPLWFHDHTLGATRLNVFAGLAGAYYLLDPVQESYFQSIHMRPVTEVVPIVLQDRMFDTNGQFYFPVDFPGGINGPTPNPQHPYWNPEFIGDTVVINGKAWPYLDVEPRRYRFLFLNGSNARTYETFLVNPATKVMGPAMWAIGNDGGFLDYPSIIDPNAAKPTESHFVIAPGERYEIIVDFSGLAGQTLLLKNVAKAPYPGGAAPRGGTTGQLMQFRVKATPVADGSYDPASGIALRPNPIVRLADPKTGKVAAGVTVAKIRQLTLNEVELMSQTATDPVTGVANTIYPGGPVEILVNNTVWSGESLRTYGDFTTVTVNGITEQVSETPNEGDVELWEIVNTTMDAHPIHTHLATFQILNRQGYDTKGFTAAYAAAFPGSGTASCPPKTYCPAFGPPLHYDPAFNTRSGGKWGGNPDVTPFLKNAVQLPDPDEVGWKDTFIAYPGMVNRFVVRFAPTDTAVNAVAGYPFSPNDGFDPKTGTLNGNLANTHGYVWHCHIIDHEDNEMMRPDVIVPLANAPRTIVKGTDY